MLIRRRTLLSALNRSLDETRCAALVETLSGAGHEGIRPRKSKHLGVPIAAYAEGPGEPRHPSILVGQVGHLGSDLHSVICGSAQPIERRCNLSLLPAFPSVQEPWTGTGNDGEAQGRGTLRRRRGFCPRADDGCS